MTRREILSAHDLYKTGLSLDEVGRRCGKSGQYLHLLFKREGLPTRPKGTLTAQGLANISRQRVSRLCPGCDCIKLADGEKFCRECTDEGILLGDLPKPPSLELEDPAAERERELAAREAVDRVSTWGGSRWRD